MLRWVLLAFCATAALFEIRRTIPDWLCLAGIVGGLIWNFEPSFAGACVGLVAALPFWIVYRADENHLKLMTAVGALAGWLGVLAIVAGATILAMVTQVAMRRRITVSMAVLGGAVVWAFAGSFTSSALTSGAHP